MYAGRLLSCSLSFCHIFVFSRASCSDKFDAELPELSSVTNIERIEIMTQQLITVEKPNIDVAEAWEGYWDKTSKLSTPILWDSSPERSAAIDLPRFQSLMNPKLPLIDFACGNGTQTRYLADHFERVIGTDVSSSAISMARSANAAPNLDYRVLDGLCFEQAQALHAEIGDANVYMRTGFHHLPVEERPAFVRSLKELLGETGVLFMIELGAGTIEFFNALAEQYGALPYELALVAEHNIAPGTVTVEDIHFFFPEHEILSIGETVFPGIHKLPSGEFATPPALYATLTHKQNPSLAQLVQKAR